MVEKLVREGVKDIPPYVPGRSREEIAKGYGLEQDRIAKMASNENPLGPPPKAVAAIREHAASSSVYPSADAAELRAALADYHGVETGQVVAGNGSDEVLDMVVRVFLDPGDEAVISTPTFSMYSSLTRVAGGRPVLVPMTGDFEYDLEGMKQAVTDRTKLVFICSPNNPTGTVVPGKGLEELLDEGPVVVVDEAYGEFADGSFAELVAGRENLVVTRTFSKAFGLAGLRVGYCITSEVIADYMLRIKIPFSVNLLAEKAALAALEDREHLEKTLELTRQGREYLTRELGRMPGLKVYPSRANFVFLDTRASGMTGAELSEALFRKGIITRDCSSFTGLDPYHLRISVGTMEENRRVVEELREIL
ncbi:MAG: histidinol-phosphate transaminase [Euryarchaeota archaeon]|nr:histidinol-phosphate transaminase [Euryarchaeota archaeon]